MTVQHLKPFSNAEEDEEEAAAARRAAALLADNKDDTPRDDEAEVYSFVERACAQGCEPVLRAAGLTAHGRALRAVLDEVRACHALWPYTAYGPCPSAGRARTLGLLLRIHRNCNCLATVACATRSARAP